MLRFNHFILFILHFWLLSVGLILSQQVEKTITGKVIDGQTLSPLPFANIAFIDSEVGTSSDEKGNFKLANISRAKSLIISYVGYKSLLVDIVDSLYLQNNIFSLLPLNIFLQEVTVYSNTLRPIDEITSLSMQSERVREISAGMPDIFRSVQSLPGISVNNEFKADFNVRGGNQDENLVIVNNAIVYEPFHIKEAANASVGIFNVDLINRVDLITGGFSARYGDKMSSVLNIHYREGSKEKYSGSASLSLAYLDGYFEGPITESSSFIFGLRKSYMEYLLKMIDYLDISTLNPSFYDVQGVISYDFSPSNKIVFEFIHAGDDFSYEPSKQTSTRIENENYKSTYYSNLFDIYSSNVLSSNAFLKTELSYYKQTDNEYRLSTDDYFNQTRIERLTYDTLDIETLEFKSDFAYQFTSKYEVNLGLSLQKIIYDEITKDEYTITDSTGTRPSPGDFGNEFPIDVKSNKYNAYLENVFQANDKLTLNIGGRMDYFGLNKDLTFSPRISAGYSLSDHTTLRAAWGYYYQSPIYRQLKSSVASDTNTQSQLAIHYILGLEHLLFFSDDINNFLKIRIEGYYKDYRNLVSSYFGTFERLTYSRNNDAIGNAKGIDVYAVLSIPNIYCWLSYGLLFANENILNDDKDEYPRYTDQRHTLSFILNADLGKAWNVTLKGNYGSGFPHTPRTAVPLNENSWNWIKSEQTHSAYLPAYKRIDVRISKNFNVFNSILNVFIDVSNVFNFKNIQGFEYKEANPIPEEVLLWPILPSFGIRYKF